MKTGILKNILCISCIAALGLGCNSSSDDDSARNVSGVWRGALTKTNDTCSSGSAAVLNFTHNVNQNEDAVTLTQDSLTYLGNFVGEDGFSVDNNSSTSGGCTDSNRIAYDAIADDDDEAAEVDLTITRVCGSVTCEIKYTGTGARAVSPAPTATPIPGATATPVGTPAATAGCSAINPRTVAGTFGGNGGCGISDVAYRFEEQGTEDVVILEPFGANGATSFVVSSSNASAGSSRRSDLSIKGEAGYLCTLACSAPSTFTVSCTKEGSASCVEKF